MFSNTAYESLYSFIGLSLHGKFIEVITSQGFFLGLILIIFGGAFFISALQFFSRYMPGTIVKRRSIPLSRFARLLVCLFLGIGILKATTGTSIYNYSGKAWNTNPYITGKIGVVPNTHKVSFLFDVLSRSAEELSRFSSEIVDSLFKVSHSQLQAPNFFYKALMYAGSQEIDDPELASRVNFYTEACFGKLLPIIGSEYNKDRLSGFWQDDSTIDRELADIPVKFEGQDVSCLEVKAIVRDHLHRFAATKSATMASIANGYVLPSGNTFDSAKLQNIYASKALVNHYLGQKEAGLGIMKGAQGHDGTTSKVIQYLTRILSIDGALTAISGGELHGAFVTAKRSQEFSEHLQRAPHIAGFIKMVLIMIFPVLVFFLAAGRWKVLVYWYAIYLSVLMWTPIWTLLYHVMNSICLSKDVLLAFGSLSDGVSLVGAQLINSRIYQMFAVYSWAQLLVGPAPTALLAWQLSPLLRDNQADDASELASEMASVGKLGASAVTGPAGGAASAASGV